MPQRCPQLAHGVNSLQIRMTFWHPTGASPVNVVDGEARPASRWICGAACTTSVLRLRRRTPSHVPMYRQPQVSEWKNWAS
jgi:hypothetical protein